MKKQIGAFALLSGLSLLGGCAIQQSPADCQLAHDAHGSGTYIAKYTLVPGSKTGTGTCDTLKAELVGARKFNPDETRTANPVVTVKPGLDRYQIDFSALGEELIPATPAGTTDAEFKKTAQYKDGLAKYKAVQATIDHTVGAETAYTEGTFTSLEAPEDSLCKMADLEPVQTKTTQAMYIPFNDTNYQRVAVDANKDGVTDKDKDGVEMYVYKPTANAEPTGVPAADYPYARATDLKVEYSDVKVYVDPLSPGQTFAGRMKYTETVGGTSCAAEYTVKAMIPAVACETDADCHPCIPSSGFTASGINPELNVTCDKEIGYCMWQGDTLPGFRSAESREKVMQECADYANKGS